jgi:hypothetical protein
MYEGHSSSWEWKDLAIWPFHRAMLWFVYNHDAFYVKAIFSVWAEFTIVDNRVGSSQGGRLYCNGVKY